VNGIGPPPAVLPDKPTLFHLAPGASLIRIYDPLRGPWQQRRSFGPLVAGGRFDHHRPPPGHDPVRAVWYASTRLVGAVAEAFGPLGFLDRSGGKRAAVVEVITAVPLLNLVGVAVRHVGLTHEIASTIDYELTQQWARAFYEQYPDLHGIRWPGRQAGAISVLLNDRAVMDHLRLIEDHDIWSTAVRARIARAARSCRLTVV
jgi:hypothetical protein